jgi:hypothetical protein
VPVPAAVKEVGRSPLEFVPWFNFGFGFCDWVGSAFQHSYDSLTALGTEEASQRGLIAGVYKIVKNAAEKQDPSTH